MLLGAEQPATPSAYWTVWRERPTGGGCHLDCWLVYEIPLHAGCRPESTGCTLMLTPASLGLERFRSAPAPKQWNTTQEMLPLQDGCPQGNGNTCLTLHKLQPCRCLAIPGHNNPIILLCHGAWVGSHSHL